MSDTDRILEEVTNETRVLSLVDSIGRGDPRKARLGGGPDYFVSEVLGSDAPGPNRKTIDRDAAKRMVTGWTPDGFESLAHLEKYQPPEWVSEYETTKYRGPLLYPIPEDWELGTVEGGAIVWRRPPQPTVESNYWEDHDGWEPENEAAVMYESTFNSGGFHPEETIVSSFSVDGTDIFSIEDCPRGELLGPVAEILARVANGDDYEDIEPPRPNEPPTPEEVAGQNGSTLGDFGGES